MTETSPPAPADHYALRLQELEQERSRLSEREELISWIRLAGFVLFVVLAWLAFVSERISGWWSLLPLTIFVALILLHGTTSRRRQELERRASHNRSGLARIEREWDGSAGGGAGFASADHPYADDLDLFGTASLFSLISVARTRGGERTLAQWLLEPAAIEELGRRRSAVRELEPRTELRESVAMLGGAAGVSMVDLDTFEAQRSTGPWSSLLRALMLLLAAANLITLAGWLALGWTSIPFAISIAVSAGVALSIRGRVAESLHGIEDLSGELDLLVELVETIEQQRFSSEGLVALQEELRGSGSSASSAIRLLARLVALLDSRRNQLFLPFALLMFWSSQLAISLDRWKERFGTSVTGWVETIGRFEALLSLSSFAWENPDYVEAEISQVREPLFEANGLGHPLIPADQLVRNDLSLGRTRLLIVSGSNMSGKSTLLRTVGVNTVLALAGAPVNAERLVLAPVQIGASIQVRDSLLEGKSRFYAEILRLRQIVDLSSGELPLLYLLDEVLHGTNSHDRTIGASAILKALVEKGAIGLATTHDLALARVADHLGERAKNIHFQDHIEQDEMIFDYQMREGVVTRSNALALMRRIGLDV
ncbi:MAG: DNA mismatch repair protein MutS [Acidobacteria bacterium]|nr:DNA mismatch repair protein MutS [Acidobacteriota bacterium]